MPAGTYLVYGQALLDNGGTSTGSAQCFLLDTPTTFFSTGTEGLGTNAADDDVAMITLEGAKSFGATTTLSLACVLGMNGSSTISASERRLIATEVGGLTNQ